jgi:aspartyl-tRNA(Asn)/glutamyl-tRNA(Gln) amidotransferase subunit A
MSVRRSTANNTTTRALKVRTLIRQDFDTVFDRNGKNRLDALLTPTTPTTAFQMGAVYGDSVMMQYADQLTVPANHAGVPGLSLPGGLDKEGLPIGIQLLGLISRKMCCCAIGRAFERVTADDNWRQVKPEY